MMIKLRNAQCNDASWICLLLASNTVISPKDGCSRPSRVREEKNVSGCVTFLKYIAGAMYPCIRNGLPANTNSWQNRIIDLHQSSEVSLLQLRCPPLHAPHCLLILLLATSILTFKSLLKAVTLTIKI